MVYKHNEGIKHNRIFWGLVTLNIIIWSVVLFYYMLMLIVDMYLVVEA